jgi:hypothetical protein
MADEQAETDQTSQVTVTPSMIEAGRAELSGYRPGWDDGDELVTRLYMAMASEGAMTPTRRGSRL